MATLLECCALTVEIRKAGHEWLVEVKGEPIGAANSATEARELADYWAARLKCVDAWRMGPSRRLPQSLTRMPAENRSRW
jgi:hypothetical protein